MLLLLLLLHASSMGIAQAGTRLAPLPLPALGSQRPCQNTGIRALQGANGCSTGLCKWFDSLVVWGRVKALWGSLFEVLMLLNAPAGL